MLEFAIRDGVKVKVRLAKLEDAPSLQRNCLSANTLKQVRSMLETDIEGTKEGNRIRLVSEVDGEVIGYLQMFFSRHPLTFHTAEIFTVVVNPEFRREGIATKMIEMALGTAKARKTEIVKIGVEAKNTPAVNLYTKVGFREYGRLQRGLVRNGEYDDEILLKRDF